MPGFAARSWIGPIPKTPGKPMFPGRSGAITADIVPATIFSTQRRDRGSRFRATGTDRASSGFRIETRELDHGRAQEGIDCFAKGVGAKIFDSTDIGAAGQESLAEALVAACHTGE